MSAALLHAGPPLLTGAGRAPLRVLHAITDLDVGGAETMLCRLLGAGQRGQFEPTVLSLLEPGVIAGRIEALGVPVLSLGMARRAPSPVTLLRLACCARRVRPDLLQGWMYHGNLAATVGAWALGRPRPVLWNVRHSLHDLAREKPLTRALIRLGARLSGLPRAIVYNSRVSAAQHEKLGYAADRAVVIPNGFDCERFRPRTDAKAMLCRALGIDPGATLIGMIGRDHPMKDPRNLISALGRLGDHPARPHLIVVGRGFDQDNRSLTQALRDHGTAGRATLAGPRDDIAEIVGGFDIAVLPSAWGEGFPNVLGEAMASGVPCVATDVGDCAWILGSAGAVVPPMDAAALAAALRNLLELGPEGRGRLGAAGRRRVLERFAIDRVVQRYEELYTEVAAQHLCRRAAARGL